MMAQTVYIPVKRLIGQVLELNGSFEDDFAVKWT